MARERGGAPAALPGHAASRRPTRPSRGTTATRMPRRSPCAPPAAGRSCGSRWPPSSASSTVEELGRGLSAITTAVLSGMLRLAHPIRRRHRVRHRRDGPVRGEELGFGSDADVMYVYRAAGASDEEAQQRAEHIVRVAEPAHRRPARAARPRHRAAAGGQERRGRALDRRRTAPTTSAGRSPGRRRHCCASRRVVGDVGVLEEFEKLADDVRYPAAIGEADVREIKRIKARVENERLPQAADPARHLKLGRGSLSDVEWFVQLLQLQHGRRRRGTAHDLDAARAGRRRGGRPRVRRRMPRSCVTRGCSRRAPARR